MTISGRLIAVIVLALGMVAPAAAQAVPSDTTVATAASDRSDKAPAKALLGRWVGTYTGYEAGIAIKGGQKIIVTQARGHVAKGTWQYKGSSGRWSAPAPVQFVVHVDDDIDVWGQDAEGYYTGDVRGERLVLSYASTRPAQVLRLVLTRR